jgi:ferredoxin-type protein NapH
VIKVRTIRVLTALLVIWVVIFGVVCKTGYGTICSFGAWGISLVCPLGFLQMALASKNVLPGLWLPVGLTLLSIVVLGRFFCGWICPTVLLREIFKGRAAPRATRRLQPASVAGPKQTGALSPANPGGPARLARHGTTSWMSYSRYAVLGGALAASFLFGFPVFCLVCPVGLFFGSVLAVSRLFIRQQPSLELLLFPALLALELLVLKRWCRSICPLGALIGLIGRLNVFVRPAVQHEECFTSRGVNCRACQKACPEGIDLLHNQGGAPLGECTKCLECYQRCPTKAIKINALGKLTGLVRLVTQRGQFLIR